MTVAREPLVRFLKSLQRHSPIDDAAGQAILELSITVRDANSNDYLIREGEPAKYCSLLISGFAFRQKLTGLGARQILSIHFPGDVLDLQNLFLRISDHNVQMMTRGQVGILDRDALKQIALSTPQVARAMWTEALIEGSLYREWIVNVGRRDARARIAHLLCEFGVRSAAAGLTTADGEGYELPMTQEQIGDAVGLTPVHVNRTLKILADEGLIRRDRRFVTIEDWDSLVAAADFSRRYLHLDQDGAADAVPPPNES